MTEDQKTVEIDEGVTVSSPDTPEQDVPPAEDTGPASMAEAVEAAMTEEGASSDPVNEEAAEEDAGEPALDQAADGEQKQAEDADPSGQSDDKLPEGDPTEDELKDYSQKANARIRDLVSQRNEASQRAERVEPIINFLETNDIPQQDLDVILDLTARLRHGDFAGFLQGVQPYVDLANQYTGKVLPPDLQQQVQQGYVSPEIAQELAQRRAQVQVTEGQAQKNQNRMQQQNAELRANTVRTAIQNWEAQTRQSDPDYDLKAEMIRRTSQALMREKGNPQTPEQALQLVNAAYEEVTKQTQSFRPQPKPTAKTPGSQGQKGGTAPVPEPTSMLDAVQNALNAHRA